MTLPNTEGVIIMKNQKMKAYIINGVKSAGIGEIDIPKPGEHEVLIKVEAAGVCGTDLHIYQGEYFSTYPLVPGHEFSGTVAAVGRGVTQTAVGQAVVSDPNIFCEKCYFCKQNLQNHCEDFQATGVTKNGAFAQYVAVPEATVFPIRCIDFAHAALIEPLACVVYGQERARPAAGQHVLVMGAGAIGLLHLQLARHNGAASVTVVDLYKERLEVAGKLGATYMVQSGPEMEKTLNSLCPKGFQTVIDATGVPAVIEKAVRFVRNDGTLLLFGVCPNDSKITVSPYEIFKRDLKIVGSFALRKTFQQAISLIEGGIIDVAPLIGQAVALDELPGAIEHMLQGKTSMKIIVKPFGK